LVDCIGGLPLLGFVFTLKQATLADLNSRTPTAATGDNLMVEVKQSDLGVSTRTLIKDTQLSSQYRMKFIQFLVTGIYCY
jgi:hypothetical protein